MKELGSELQTIAKGAAHIILPYFKQQIDVSVKNNDPFNFVTRADKESDDYICTALQKAFPKDQILPEEGAYRPSSYAGQVWMVDPLDATAASNGRLHHELLTHIYTIGNLLNRA